MSSQKVSSELVSSVTCEQCAVKCRAFSADLPDHLIHFRKYVSRKAATKGRAVLEGVGLLTETMDACFTSRPLDEEGAVQAGLTRWSGEQGVCVCVCIRVCVNLCVLVYTSVCMCECSTFYYII